MTITTDEPKQLADTLRIYPDDMQRVADAFEAELPPGTDVDWRPLDGCLLGRWWATIDGPQRDARPIQTAIQHRLGALSVDVGVLSAPLMG